MKGVNNETYVIKKNEIYVRYIIKKKKTNYVEG